MAKLLGIPKSRGLEAMPHTPAFPEAPSRAFLSGSLQKVTIDRVLRLVEAAGLEADIRIRRAA